MLRRGMFLHRHRTRKGSRYHSGKSCGLGIVVRTGKGCGVDRSWSRVFFSEFTSMSYTYDDSSIDCSFLNWRVESHISRLNRSCSPQTLDSRSRIAIPFASSLECYEASSHNTSRSSSDAGLHPGKTFRSKIFLSPQVLLGLHYTMCGICTLEGTFPQALYVIRV